MYNLTNFTAGNSSFVNSMSAVNDVTNGFFWVFITLALWVVLSVAMQRNGILPAIVASSFITGITGILFILAGLIGEGYLIYYILSIGLAVAAGFVAGKGED